MTNHIDLSTIVLEKGAHEDRDGGCVMEWVALFNHEEKTDHPACTSPVLTAFAIAFNDGVDNETRQRLVPFIPRLVGTAGDLEADERRAWMATDWLVRRFTPAWLRKCGLGDRAAELEELDALTSAELARAAQPIIEKARAEASAAWDAAWDAARAATWAATRDATRDAAWDATWAAAWDATRAAAWDAAGDAAGDATRAATWAAAWDATRAATWAAAWDAAGDEKGYTAQYAAAREAADQVIVEKLGDTIAELREDALRLFSDMIDVRVTA